MKTEATIKSNNKDIPASPPEGVTITTPGVSPDMSRCGPLYEWRNKRIRGYLLSRKYMLY